MRDRDRDAMKRTEKLIDRLVEGGLSPAELREKETAGRGTAKRAHEKKRPRATRRKAQKEENPSGPYTLEPHPEL